MFKRYLLLLLIVVPIMLSFKGSEDSCCTKSNLKRCVGSTPCTACSTCSACKYCVEGKTCGVCAYKSSIIGYFRGQYHKSRQRVNPVTLDNARLSPKEGHVAAAPHDRADIAGSMEDRNTMHSLLEK